MWLLLRAFLVWDDVGIGYWIYLAAPCALGHLLSLLYWNDVLSVPGRGG